MHLHWCSSWCYLSKGGKQTRFHFTFSKVFEHYGIDSGAIAEMCAHLPLSRLAVFESQASNKISSWHLIGRATCQCVKDVKSDDHGH